MFCPQCGAESDGSSLFCRQCGAALGRGPAPTSLLGEARAIEGPGPSAPAPISLPHRGTLFAARYEILEELGRGGMGIVYKAHDARLTETIALKLLLPQYTAEPKILERFLSEVRMARRLSHPNIVKVYDLGEAEGTVYFSMEYLEGRSLEALLDEEGPLATDRATDIVRSTALALETAHRARVVHRDVKPQNIFLTNEQVVKVLDFGIAKALDGSGASMTGGMIGTPAYMAPEQVTSGGVVDDRTDIYSLGVVMYQIFTGRPPFQGNSPFEVALMHVHEEPPPPRETNPLVPIHIERIIQRAMQKDPLRRYESLADMIADLDRRRAPEPLVLLDEGGVGKRTVLLPTEKPASDPMLVPTHLESGEAAGGAGEEPRAARDAPIPLGPADPPVPVEFIPPEEQMWVVLSGGKLVRGLTLDEVKEGVASGRFGPSDRARHRSSPWHVLSAYPQLAESLARARTGPGAGLMSPVRVRKSASSVARRVAPVALLVAGVLVYQVIRSYLVKSSLGLELESVLAQRYYVTDARGYGLAGITVSHPERHVLEQDMVEIAKRNSIRCRPSEDLAVWLDPKRKSVKLVLDYELPMLFIPIRFRAEREKEGLRRAQIRRLVEDPDTRILGASAEDVLKMLGR